MSKLNDIGHVKGRLRPLKRIMLGFARDPPISDFAWFSVRLFKW